MMESSLNKLETNYYKRIFKLFKYFDWKLIIFLWCNTLNLF